MAVGNTSGDAILVGADDQGIHVSARGSIRAALCFPLRESLLARLDESAGIRAVLVDLSECRYMDSTFIGLLVAIDKKLRRIGGGRLHLVRPSGECREILAQLGLQDYLLVEETPREPPAGMTELSATEKPGADFILKAHEALMETSEEARRKFGLLKEMLEKKLRGEKPPKENPEE